MSWDKSCILKTFYDAITKEGFFVEEILGDLYIIDQDDPLPRPLILKLIEAIPVNPTKLGSVNGIEIKAIGFLTFIPSKVEELDYYVFAFENKPDNRIDFIVISCSELNLRLVLVTPFVNSTGLIGLKFWLLPNNLLFETTRLGAEGEWWLIGGGMAENTERDYSKFLNGWNQLK